MQKGNHGSQCSRRDLDVQFIDYYSPQMSFVTCHQWQVTPRHITAEPRCLMLYLEMKTREVHGKDERGRPNRQTAGCLATQRSFRDRWKSLPGVTAAPPSPPPPSSFLPLPPKVKP